MPDKIFRGLEFVGIEARFVGNAGHFKGLEAFHVGDKAFDVHRRADDRFAKEILGIDRAGHHGAGLVKGVLALEVDRETGQGIRFDFNGAAAAGRSHFGSEDIVAAGRLAIKLEVGTGNAEIRSG